MGLKSWSVPVFWNKSIPVWFHRFCSVLLERLQTSVHHELSEMDPLTGSIITCSSLLGRNTGNHATGTGSVGKVLSMFRVQPNYIQFFPQR